MLSVTAVLRSLAYLQSPGAQCLSAEELELCACLKRAATPLTLAAAVRCLRAAGYEVEPVYLGETPAESLHT